MRKSLRGMGFMLAMSYRASPLLTIGTFGLTAIGSVLQPVSVWATKRIVDGVVAVDSDAVLRAVLLLAAARMISNIAANHGMTTLRMNMEDRTRLHIDTLMLELNGGLPGLEHLERRDVADEMALLRSQAGSLAQPAGPLVFLLQVGTMGIGTLGLLAALHPALLLVPLFGVPGVILGGRAAKLQQDTQEGVMERMRLSALLFFVGTAPAPGKEVRVFGLAPVLDSRLRGLQDETLGEMTRARVKGALLTGAGALVFAAAYIGALALVALEALDGRTTVGDVVIAVTATATVSGLVSSAVTNATWLNSTLRTINRFVWLVDYAAEARSQPSDPAEVPDRIETGITVEGVSFTYPGTDDEVLRDVELLIPAGSTVAIVGDNGAGKTSLVKLLCRFYEPTAGRVCVDGVDIARFDHDSWRARLAAGFQDFAAFELVARENVGVGDLAGIESPDRVHEALDRANATDVLTSLPSGLETQLGKSFEGGVDLSTGQWQKLALGRALMRETPLLLLLDEPTASLDAQTEHALFERYAQGARRAGARTGAVTILVSHRFSTVRMADLILVVDGGTIAEQGTHESLVERDGLYAELYRLQASAYR